MANQISKKEYLKRYLEKDKVSDGKRKKKLKPKANVSRLKIIDEDIDIKSINFDNKVEDNEEDEAPVVAEVIDERPVEEKLKELYEPSRWKKVNGDEVSQSSIAAFSGNSDSKSDVESFKKHSNIKGTESASRYTTSKKARHDSDYDISPPRHQVKNSSRRHDSDLDISPLRNQKQHSDNDISPPRSRKQNKYSAQNDSDGDISPPRSQKENRRHDSSISPLINRIQHSDSDISPPRSHKQSKYGVKLDSDNNISRSHHHSSNKQSQHSKSRSKRQIESDDDVSFSHHKTVKRSVKGSSKRHDCDSDNSSPHHKSVNKLNISANVSSKIYDSDSDISPPRHKTVNKSGSPVKISSRKQNSDIDVSPPHNKANQSNTRLKNSFGRYDSDSDEKSSQYRSSRMLQPNKIKRESQLNSDSDISPPRSSSGLSSIKVKDEKMSRTLSGLKAGLQNSETLQQEVEELRKREKNHLNMLEDEISGRNAETIIRDRKTGRKRDLNKEKEAKAEENKKTKEYQEKYSRWGKGIEQAEDKMEKFKDDLYEMSKPLARYADDVDLDEKLKAVIREGDVMAEFIKKKRNKDKPNFPVYSGPPAPPNRFGILPGYRWDGVDRSNGFEKKYFEKINNTKATQDEAYLWSVQDM